MAKIPEKVLREATDAAIQEIITKAENYTFKRCPDQIVASLQKKDGKFCWSKKITTKKQKFFKRKVIVQKSYVPKDDNIILLILESPHKDEFAGKINGPAYGQTGININDYFVEILNTIESLSPTEFSSCKIIIMNAIQYACSLELSLNILKNSMLKKLWEKDCVKKIFRNRIKTILSATNEKEKRMVVINCCTKPIKEDVSCELKELGFVKNIYEVPHPASWRNGKKITINDILANEKITITLGKKDDN